jgi:hypothetical protein
MLKVGDRILPEHRYLMEKKLGRSLTKGEVVHHIDGNGNNNNLNNLSLCKNRSEHTRIHGLSKKYKCSVMLSLLHKKFKLESDSVNELGDTTYMIMGKYIKDSEIKEIEEEYKRQIINTLSKEIKGVESQLSIGTNAKTNNLLRGKIFAYKHAIDIVYNLKKD